MFNIAIYIPSLQEKWRAKPYNTFHQKEICKVLYEEDDILFIETVNDILTECIHPKHNINRLTIVDKLLLLLKIRCIAAGTTMEFESETEDKKKYTINYNFYDIYVKLHNISVDIKPLKINSNNFEIQCYLPLIGQEIAINNSIKNNISYEQLLYYFIDYIKINNHTFNIRELDEHNQSQLINILPITIVKDIQIYIDNIITKFNEIIIYNLFDKKISFSLISNLYTDYCKFIIKDNLHSIYQEIYILNKHINISSEYIENLTPIEREIYISSLRKENKSSSSDLPANAAVDNNMIPQDNIIDTIDEFKYSMGG